MENYRNLSGKSGVMQYEIGSDYIKVYFKDGGSYLYNDAKTGRQNVEEMKRLARNGLGLNSFINTNVRKKYASKLS